MGTGHMPGKLLIIDSIATNRIILKVRLSDAFYDVSQAATLNDAQAQISQSSPDLIFVSDQFSERDIKRFTANVRKEMKTSQIPVVLLASETNRDQRLASLRCGFNEVMVAPMQDPTFLARLRSLLRGFDLPDESKMDTSVSHGFADRSQPYKVRPKLLLTTNDTATSLRWRGALKPLLPFALHSTPLENAMQEMSKTPIPDVFVIAVDHNQPETAMRLVAEIRAQKKTRRTGILAIMQVDEPRIVVDMLDLGAHDVITEGFDPEEIALRVSTLVQQKRLSDRLRKNMQVSVQASVTDPLTGLFNRRYAIPHLGNIHQNVSRKTAPLAVMIADLDHFKRVNDEHGHAIGDAVLCEAARRLRDVLPSTALLARIGGEEFLVALPETPEPAANEMATRMCEAIQSTEIIVKSSNIRVPMTLSVGVTMAEKPDLINTVEQLMDDADQALYAAKQNGRNRVCFHHPQA